MTDRDLTRAEVEAWISNGPSHGVHINNHALNRILRQFLRCMDERDAAEAEIARLREALERIADTDPDEGTSWFHNVARAALKPAPTVTASWPTEEGEGSIIVGNVKGESHD
jgi:hypothetical protein